MPSKTEIQQHIHKRRFSRSGPKSQSLEANMVSFQVSEQLSKLRKKVHARFKHSGSHGSGSHGVNRISGSVHAARSHG